MDELGIEEVVGRGEETVTVSLGGDYVVVQNGEAKSKPGTIYLEARMKDNTFGWDAAKASYTWPEGCHIN
jgi:hypothetical protein